MTCRHKYIAQDLPNICGDILYICSICDDSYMTDAFGARFCKKCGMLPEDCYCHVNWNEAKVAELPKCDFCGQPAKYDAATKQGAWAFMCESDYQFERRFADLGLGKGQKLVKAGA